MLRSIQRGILNANNIPALSVKRFYKTDLSLENIYPNSSLKITTPSPPPQGLKFSGYIPMNELEITFSGSSGPGGQNVQKVNTKVDLRFKIDTASFISNETKKSLIEQNKHRTTKDGYFVIKSEVTRYQQMNIADALEKLRTLIRDAEKPKTKVLSPENIEVIQKRQEKAARERLYIKRHRAHIKADRQADM